MNTRMYVKMHADAYASRHTCSMHAAGSKAHELKVDMAAEKYVFDTLLYIYAFIYIYTCIHGTHNRRNMFLLHECIHACMRVYVNIHVHHLHVIFHALCTTRYISFLQQEPKRMSLYGRRLRNTFMHHIIYSVVYM